MKKVLTTRGKSEVVSKDIWSDREKVRYFDNLMSLLEWDWEGFSGFVGRHSPDYEIESRANYARYLLTHFPCLADEWKRMRDGKDERDWKGKCTRCGSVPIVCRKYGEKYERLCERCADEK